MKIPQRISSKKNGWGFVDFNQPMHEISRKEPVSYTHLDVYKRQSIETPAKLTVVRDNVYEQKIKIEGEIASHPFTQVILSLIHI